MNLFRKINRILFVVVLATFLIIKSAGGNNLLLAYVGLLLFFTLFPLAIVELYFLLFQKKRSWLTIVLLIPVSGFLTFQIWLFSGSWSADIENVLVFPEGYDKDYAIVVYGVEAGESIEPSFGTKRVRKLVFPKNGIYLTSTISKTTLDAIDYPTPSVYIGDKQLQKSEWNQAENKWTKGFRVSNSSESGYFFKFIDLNHAGYYPDSVLKADGINFRDFSRSDDSDVEATEAY